MSQHENIRRDKLLRARVVAEPSRLRAKRASCPLIRIATLAVTIFILCPAFSLGQNGKITLNESAFAYAKELIARGDVLVDKKNEWGDHHPTALEQNEFVRERGFGEYGKWHLGMDATHAETSKSGYKFPFGDFKRIHRCALLAVKSRAHQYGYSDIENAANQLLEMLDSRKRH